MNNLLRIATVFSMLLPVTASRAEHRVVKGGHTYIDGVRQLETEAERRAWGKKLCNEAATFARDIAERRRRGDSLDDVLHDIRGAYSPKSWDNAESVAVEVYARGYTPSEADAASRAKTPTLCGK